MTSYVVGSVQTKEGDVYVTDYSYNQNYNTGNGEYLVHTHM